MEQRYMRNGAMTEPEDRVRLQSHSVDAAHAAWASRLDGGS